MIWIRRAVWLFDRSGSEILGWVFVAAGLAMLVLPGPGLLGLAAGVWLLARHNRWARHILEPVQTRAVVAAKQGVASWPRVVFSALGALSIAAVGLIWGLDPEIGTFTVAGIRLGPHLPFGGWWSGGSLFFSSIVAMSVLIYTARRYGPRGSAGVQVPATPDDDLVGAQPQAGSEND